MLTVVTCSRADDRAPPSVHFDFLKWNQLALPYAQFLIVEWGVPSLCWPALSEVLSDFERLHVIYVPQDVVDEHSRDGVFAEYTAKNVGIWRADDGLILSTNIDCFISPELAGQIRAACEIPQRMDTVYRAPRWDFKGDMSDSEAQTFIAKHHQAEAAGDFTMAHRAVWRYLEGYLEIPGQRAHLDSELIDHAQRRGCPITYLSPVWHRAHEPGTWRGQEVKLPVGARPKQPAWGLRDESFQLTGTP